MFQNFFLLQLYNNDFKKIGSEICTESQLFQRKFMLYLKNYDIQSSLISLETAHKISKSLKNGKLSLSVDQNMSRIKRENEILLII